MSNSYKIAQEITDEIMGEGTYAKINAGNPDPGVQGAIATAKAQYPEFMKGYERNLEVSTKLAGAMIKVIAACPKQRLGQVIMNAIPVEADLYLMHDEELVEYLEKYFEEFGEP